MVSPVCWDARRSGKGDTDARSWRTLPKVLLNSSIHSLRSRRVRVEPAGSPKVAGCRGTKETCHGRKWVAKHYARWWHELTDLNSGMKLDYCGVEERSQ